MTDNFPSNEEYFKNKPKEICPICKQEILKSQIKVPRMNDDMQRETVHRDCENSTNDYMQWNEDGTDTILTFKGQIMNYFKGFIILAVFINEKLHGRSIFDDEPNKPEVEH